MFRRIFAAAAACALLLLAGPAMAQEPSTAPGVREHDGFFLQLQYGGGYLNLSDTQASSPTSGASDSLATTSRHPSRIRGVS